MIVDQLALRRGLLPDQVIREFFAVAQRRGFVAPKSAREIARALCERLEVVTSTLDDLRAASELAERYRLQYYDALLCCTAKRGGCAFLLSRDMQDGFMVGTLRVVDPFAEKNGPLVAELLA